MIRKKTKRAHISFSIFFVSAIAAINGVHFQAYLSEFNAFANGKQNLLGTQFNGDTLLTRGLSAHFVFAYISLMHGCQRILAFHINN